MVGVPSASLPPPCHSHSHWFDMFVTADERHPWLPSARALGSIKGRSQCRRAGGFGPMHGVLPPPYRVAQNRFTARKSPVLLLVTPPAPGSPYMGDVSRPPSEFTLWADSGNGSAPSGKGATADARGAQEGAASLLRVGWEERKEVGTLPCVPQPASAPEPARPVPKPRK